MGSQIREIALWKAVTDRFLVAWETGKSQGTFISFESEELLWKTLTIKRWQILKLMTSAGELTIREVARRAERHVKAVHGDVSRLLQCGLLDKTDSGRVIFPYDSVHVDFMLWEACWWLRTIWREVVKTILSSHRHQAPNDCSVLNPVSDSSSCATLTEQTEIT